MSLGESHTVKALGTTVPPRTPTERWSSISRTIRRPSSTGRSPLLNARAKAPSTRRSSRRSNPRIPIADRGYRSPTYGLGRRIDRALRSPSPTRASGGIGRRAGFRCQCPKGRGGSTPPSRTAKARRSPERGFDGPFPCGTGAGSDPVERRGQREDDLLGIASEARRIVDVPRDLGEAVALQ